ncbi:MAG: HTH domain-containing protein [Haloarculaceae archaeon]
MSNPTQRRAELYLRGDTYGTFGTQQSVLNRVNRLEGEGVLDEATVAGEWQRIRTLAEDCRDGAVETYEEFADWARRNGYSLEPAFERRTRSYVGLDRVDDVVVFPVVSLAMYEADQLQAVFPCTDEDGESYTVQDCLEAFERGDADWLAQFDAITVDRAEPRLKSKLAV